jgi:RNA polymerase sigma factor (sigma-70 family)
VIEILAKKDAYWRKIALNICKDKELADDLVQDMYIKLIDCKKQINDFYVVIVIRNLFLDHIKQTKKRGHVNLDDFYTLESQNNTFEIDDEQKEIIDNMYWVAKGYFELSQDMSLREMAKELNTNYVYIHRVMKKAKENLK